MTTDMITELQGNIVKLSTIIYSTIGILQRDAPPAGQESQAFLTGQEAMARDFMACWRQCSTLIDQLEIALSDIKLDINQERIQQRIQELEAEREAWRVRGEWLQSRYIELTNRLLSDPK